LGAVTQPFSSANSKQRLPNALKCDLVLVFIVKLLLSFTSILPRQTNPTHHKLSKPYQFLTAHPCGRKLTAKINGALAFTTDLKKRALVKLSTKARLI
jgi:hypothetical protein